MFKIVEGLFQLRGVSGRVAEVDLQNRLLVSMEAPTNPVGVTDISHTQFSEVAENNYTDTYYTITPNKILVIDYIRGSSEDNEKSSSVSVYYDEDGTANNLALIAVGFTNGTSFEYNINRQFTGDGIKRIVLRRERLDAGDRDIFGQFTGHEQ